MDVVMGVSALGVFISLFASHYSRTAKARDGWHNAMAVFTLVIFLGLAFGGYVDN